MGIGYERFTDRARMVLQFANQEACRFNHEYIGTEHILLGLVKEGNGVAAKVLESLGVDLRKIRLEVEKFLQSGPEMVTMGKMPQTPRAKRAIQFAREEAVALGHNYVGTEHLLLGLLRENEGVAAQVLTKLSVGLEQVRTATLEMLGFKQRVDADGTCEGDSGRKYKIGEQVPLTFSRTECNFDRACYRAMRMANSAFGVDIDGHLRNVDVERSQVSIHVKFVGYEAIGGMGGWSHVYTFEAWVEVGE